MKLHTLSGYIQFIYLIEDEQGLLLLDGCSRADVKRVCSFIKYELKRSITDLKLIVVTHMHPDHAGGAHKLRATTGAKIAAHPNTRNWYAGMSGRTAHVIDVMLTWWVAGRLGKPKRKVWYPPLLQPDILLNDRDALPDYPAFQVVYTPGHTNHDISILHMPTQQMYVADLVVRVKGELMPPYPLCHPNQYKQSLAKVAALNVTTLYCAHVPPLANPSAVLTTMLKKAPTFPKNHWYSFKGRVLGKLRSKR
ncbi:MBL fold metallo-hydrolase [Alteromonas ponticola]|uniref:MBL fold metallo-hydrolase n=1 Tax=Alteromonas aquimaris TaxID=2998417 RepID=A0ABT3PAW0_9ALTE|nr:MBL fold metallo-hydrolase [Alteromonas aquimaris]MCW8109916.1 MBL fold metallo-hydrolase [Alteromonas aquimaris]